MVKEQLKNGVESYEAPQVDVISICCRRVMVGSYLTGVGTTSMEDGGSFSFDE